MNTNRYLVQQKRRAISLNGPAALHMQTTTGHKLKNVGLGLLGLAGGSFIGMQSGAMTIPGLIVCSIGFAFEKPLVIGLGAGMAVAPTSKKAALAGTDEISGQDQGVDGFKESLTAYKDFWYEKIFMKAPKKKTTTDSAAKTINGLGDVKYFAYPENLSGDELLGLEGPNEPLAIGRDLQIGSLEDYERELAADAMQYASVSGLDLNSIEGTEVEGLEGEEQRLYGADDLSGDDYTVSGPEDVSNMLL